MCEWDYRVDLAKRAIDNYVKFAWSSCPACHDHNIEAANPEVGGCSNRIYIDVVCNNARCGFKWTDVYVLTTIQAHPDSERKDK